jgi:hypothetical protein
MIKTSVAAAISLFAFLLSAQTVSAATVTQCGPTICYEYDDAQAAVALFGQPTFSGDVVRFLPLDFRAESVDGGGTDLVNATFDFKDIYAHTNGVKNGNDIVYINVRELGDYEIINDGDVSVGLNLIASHNTDFFTPPKSSIAEFDAAGHSGGLQNWDINATLKPLEDPSPWSDSSTFALRIQNTLTASTGANGDIAWIQKKITLVASEVVPIPAAVWLFGSGLGLLGFMRRRKFGVQ